MRVVVLLLGLKLGHWLSESSCHAPSLVVAVTSGAPCVNLCVHRGCILLVVWWRRRVKGAYSLVRVHLNTKKKFTPAIRVVVITKKGMLHNNPNKQNYTNSSITHYHT
jgi:hypothetical protein